MGKACSMILSSLPDDILVHIISFLPTLYAIRTSVLSKRWRFLWMESPSIRLDEREFNDALRRENAASCLHDGKDLKVHGGHRSSREEEEYEEELRWRFNSAVYDIVSSSHTASQLDVFDVSFLAPFRGVQDYLTELVRYLTMNKKIKKLCINFHSPRIPFLFRYGPLSFDQCPCETITYLEINRHPIILSPFSYKSFVSIQTLVIEGSHQNHDAINTFLTSCPSLQRCVINRLQDVGLFQFSAPWLKVLTLTRPNLTVFQINAPCLECFTIRDHISTVVRLHGMKSLNTVNLLETSTFTARSFLTENCEELRHVTQLEIPSFDTSDLDEWRAENQNKMGVNWLDSLEHLVLASHMLQPFSEIAFLLDAAPKARKLTLMYTYTFEECEPQLLKEFLSQKWFDDNDSYCESLKNVKDILLSGVGMMHLKLAEFLLKNARALESLRIHFQNSIKYSTRLSFARKLLPRSRRRTPKVRFY